MIRGKLNLNDVNRNQFWEMHILSEIEEMGFDSFFTKMHTRIFGLEQDIMGIFTGRGTN